MIYSLNTGHSNIGIIRNPDIFVSGFQMTEIQDDCSGSFCLIFEWSTIQKLDTKVWISNAISRPCLDELLLFEYRTCCTGFNAMS